MTNPAGRFGIHGGQYVPETLMNTLIELEEAYGRLKYDPGFQDELSRLLDEYIKNGAETLKMPKSLMQQVLFLYPNAK